MPRYAERAARRATNRREALLDQARVEKSAALLEDSADRCDIYGYTPQFMPAPRRYATLVILADTTREYYSGARAIL